MSCPCVHCRRAAAEAAQPPLVRAATQLGRTFSQAARDFARVTPLLAAALSGRRTTVVTGHDGVTRRRVIR